MQVLTLEALVAEACRLVPDDLSDEQKEAFFITKEEPVCTQTKSTAGVPP